MTEDWKRRLLELHSTVVSAHRLTEDADGDPLGVEVQEPAALFLAPSSLLPPDGDEDDTEYPS